MELRESKSKDTGKPWTLAYEQAQRETVRLEQQERGLWGEGLH